jgi:excisionase family DNA binding protein
MEDDMDHQREWFSAEELRRWLGLGKTKTQEILQTGQIPSYRIGRVRRIRRADIEHFLEQNRFESGR